MTDPAGAIDPFTSATVYPLLVVTTVAPDGERSGCLAGFVTQCSIDPPRFLVCISKANHTFDVVGRASVLALHLLGRDQLSVASLFGERTGDEVDKFAEADWHPGPKGVPVLDSCVAWVALGIADRIDAGDHTALLAYPLDGGTGHRHGVLTNLDAPSMEPGHPAD